MRVSIVLAGMTLDADVDPGSIVTILDLADWRDRTSILQPRPPVEHLTAPLPADAGRART